jgi:branched-chain amino acid transport system substrate-binding protein
MALLLIIRFSPNDVQRVASVYDVDKAKRGSTFIHIIGNMKKTLLAALAIAVILLILCFALRPSTSKTDLGATMEPIKIGVITSLDGFAAPWGEYGKMGVELAAKAINEKGGINGRKIELVIENDHTDGKQGVSAWNKLVSIDHVKGIIGGVFDFTAQPLMPLALRDKVSFISPSNFRIEGGFELNEQSFVMMTDFNRVVRYLKDYISAKKIKKLAVVHFKSTFGDEIAKTLNGVMQELGESGIIDEQYTEIGSNDFKTLIAKLKSKGVEAVFLDAVGNDPVNFLSRAKQAGFKPTIIGYNGITDAFANETDKSLTEDIVILNWEITGQEFSKLFETAYNMPPSKSVDKFFDAVYVLGNAIANTKDSTGTAGYIANRTFTTPNGTFTFSKEHQTSDTPVEIDIVKGGVLVPWKK